MADRVHPRDSPPAATGADPATMPSSSEAPLMPPAHNPHSDNIGPHSENSGPPSGTYVVQVPKDQIYRYPPPENTRRFQNYTRKKSRRGCFSRCLCWTIGLLFLLIALIAVTAGILYLVYRPKAPKYTVDDIAIRGINLTSSGSISPEFDVTIRAQNPNDKIGIYYRRGSSVNVYYSDVNLCGGVLPTFYQPPNNLTVFQTALKGSNIVLASGLQTELVNEQRQGRVPLRLNLRAPVKIKVGSVKTWTITVKVKCDLTVDSLAADSKIVSKQCDYRVKLW